MSIYTIKERYKYKGYEPILFEAGYCRLPERIKKWYKLTII